MNFIELPLVSPVPLASGTQVTGAWIGEGPIVLVQGMSREGGLFRTRLDLQKEMFIDQMPSDLDLKEAPTVSESVRQTREESLR